MMLRNHQSGFGICQGKGKGKSSCHCCWRGLSKSNRLKNVRLLYLSWSNLISNFLIVIQNIILQKTERVECLMGEVEKAVSASDIHSNEADLGSVWVGNSEGQRRDPKLAYDGALFIHTGRRMRKRDLLGLYSWCQKTSLAFFRGKKLLCKE